MRKGYKKTEVGVIPEDWKVKALSAVLKIRHGKSQKDIETINGKYPILGTGGKMGTTNSFLYNKPSVLIGRKGTIDKPRYMESPFWTVDTLFYSEIYSNAVSKYLFYNFLLIDWYSHNEASGVPSLNASKIEGIKIPLPPLPEQTAIATVLSDTDNLIQALEKKIAKKQLIKKGAMQKLLSPKEGWVVKTLGEIMFSNQLGGNYRNTEAISKSPLIKMGNLGRGNIELSKLEYIPSNIIPNNNDKLKYGDVILNTRNTLDLVGKVSIWRKELPIAYFNSNIMRLKFKEQFVSSNFYMNYVFNTKNTISQLRNIATGTTSVAAIYTRDLLNITFVLPPLYEQTHIATLLSDMDKEIETLENKLAKYKDIKQGLMQVLLTGKIRLV